MLWIALRSAPGDQRCGRYATQWKYIDEKSKVF